MPKYIWSSFRTRGELLKRAIRIVNLAAQSFYLRFTPWDPGVLRPHDFLFVIHIYYLDGVAPALRFAKRTQSAVWFTSSRTRVIERLQESGQIVFKVENRGRNFGGLFSRSVVEDSNAKFIVHLHWKKSLHSPLFGALWNFILWSHLTSSRKLHQIENCVRPRERMLAMVDMSNVFSSASRNWGRSKKQIDDLDAENRDLLSKVTEFSYPMGGMFACSKILFDDLARLWMELPHEAMREPIGLDENVVHFFERSVGALNYSKGGRLVKL